MSVSKKYRGTDKQLKALRDIVNSERNEGVAVTQICRDANIGSVDAVRKFSSNEKRRLSPKIAEKLWEHFEQQKTNKKKLIPSYYLDTLAFFEANSHSQNKNRLKMRGDYYLFQNSELENDGFIVGKINFTILENNCWVARETHKDSNYIRSKIGNSAAHDVEMEEVFEGFCFIKSGSFTIITREINTKRCGFSIFTESTHDGEVVTTATGHIVRSSNNKKVFSSPCVLIHTSIIRDIELGIVRKSDLDISIVKETIP